MGEGGQVGVNGCSTDQRMEVRADGRSGRIEGPAVETAAAGAVFDRTRGLPSQAGRGECDWAIGLASR